MCIIPGKSVGSLLFFGESCSGLLFPVTCSQLTETTSAPMSLRNAGPLPLHHHFNVPLEHYQMLCSDNAKKFLPVSRTLAQSTDIAPFFAVAFGGCACGEMFVTISRQCRHLDLDSNREGCRSSGLPRNAVTINTAKASQPVRASPADTSHFRLIEACTSPRRATKLSGHLVTAACRAFCAYEAIICANVGTSAAAWADR